MKKALNLITKEIYYFKDGVKKIIDKKDKKTYPKNIYGNISGIYGDISGIFGDINEIYGDISGLSGDISGIYGDISGIYGDITNIIGNIDDCKLTKKERTTGVDIRDLLIN